MLCWILLLVDGVRLISGQTVTGSTTNGLSYGSTVRFSYTGSLQSYIVPSGVYAINVTLAGGCGMNYGGRGNILNATIVTSPQSLLYISVAGGFSTLNGTTLMGGGGAGWGPTSTGGMLLYQFTHVIYLYPNDLPFDLLLRLSLTYHPTLPHQAWLLVVVQPTSEQDARLRNVVWPLPAVAGEEGLLRMVMHMSEETQGTPLGAPEECIL